ncbi:hypothetical protein OAD38_01075 [Ascidiaceihabitans sp.]|nr:hypothetical protein [Ascidiaceihabitans sp.]
MTISKLKHTKGSSVAGNIDLSTGSFVEPIYQELSGSLTGLYSELFFKTSGPKHTAKRMQVFGSIIRAALLDSNREVYWISYKTNFTSEGYGVSHKAFYTVVKAMNQKGWLSPRTDQIPRDGYARRWIVAQSLIDSAASLELDFEDVSPNFGRPPLKPQELIKVKHRTLPDYLYNKGYRLPSPVVPTEAKEALVSSLNHINELALSSHTFEGLRRRNGSPLQFRGFYRTFNHNLQGGGRTYGACEAMRPKDRLNIKIDGEAVAEIDVVSCQPTILFSRGIVDHLPREDAPIAYDFYSSVVTALDGQLTREDVKAVVTKALGTANIPKHRWPEGLEKVRERLSEGPSGCPKWSDIVGVLLEHMPFLDLLKPVKEDTFTLQNTESSILHDAMYGLYKHKGAAVLPVHDSLVVPQSKVEVTKKALENAFWFKTGVVPMLRTTYL